MCQCLHPFALNVNTDPSLPARYIYVGCGKCILCKARNANEWSFRLRAEAKFATDAYFLTFTFDNEHLPKGFDLGFRYVQNFMKRCRKAYKFPSNFKYFTCSELGGEHGRLHYHSIWFNTGLNWKGLQKLISSKWRAGRIDIQFLNNKRINYVSSYVLQGAGEEDKIVYYQTVRRPFKSSPTTVCTVVKLPNYFKRSVSKGLGTAILTPRFVDYVISRGDGSIRQDGLDISLPRYYIDKIFLEGTALRDEVKQIRLNRAIEDYENIEKLNFAYAEAVSLAREAGEPQPPVPPELMELLGKADKLTSRKKKFKFLKPDGYYELIKAIKDAIGNKDYGKVAELLCFSRVNYKGSSDVRPSDVLEAAIKCVRT